MKCSITKWKAAALLVGALLAGCGGGSAPPDKPDVSAPQSANDKSWHYTTVSTNGVAVFPGAVYDEFDTVPALDWLQRDGATLSYKTLSYDQLGGWTNINTVASAFPASIINNTFMSARSTAGDWLLVSWTDINGAYIRLTGPGTDSGVVLLSRTSGPWNVVLSVTATGQARVAWLESTSQNYVENQVHTGHFESGAWVVDAPVASQGAASRVYGQTVGQDGRGWIFYGAGQVFGRSFDVVNGLGPEVRIDDPILAGARDAGSVMVKGHGAGVTVAMSLGTEGCIATRQFDGSNWGAVACMNNSMPAHSFPVYDLTTTSSGKAMLAWVDGHGLALHVSNRLTASGPWLAPTSIPLNGMSPYVIVGRMADNGKAAIGYAAYLSQKAKGYVATSRDGQTWTAPLVPGLTPGQPDTSTDELLRFDLELDENGDPGILSFVHSGGHDNIVFTNMVDGRWTDVHVLQASVDLADYVYVGRRYIMSMNRLVSLGGQRWAAFWELRGDPGVQGHKVVAARFD